MKRTAILTLLMILLTSSIVLAQSTEFTFVFLNARTDKAALPEDELKKIMDGHMANINRLAKEGKLMAAGPFDGGGGIFIFKSNSVEQVKEWLQTDPGVQANRWNVEILPYIPRVGSVCTVKEPYEMVTYQFIRFVPNIAKYTIGSLTDSFKKHDAYLKAIAKTGNVVTEAIFGATDGGILIMKGEVQRAVIENDPAVLEGVLQPDFKTLWIAKGAFCEK
jgi:uncharacterized protein YciI